jgi:hypothetical protein
MELDWIEVIGAIAAIEILAAYGLNSFQKIKSDSLLFYLLNLTGGILFVYYTISKDAKASAVVNIVWVIIAIVGLITKYKRR